MANISYENIDLFYYHSIDIDFSRLFSIINNGIVSKMAAIDEQLKYYYRNYTHSSTKDEYISVNHFPRTIFRYYKIENELYDFNTNKISFVIDDIIPLEKQSYKNRYNYTNERHVHYKINSQEIKGILLREIDANKKLSEIEFNHNFTDQEYFENKVFTTINFFVDVFGTFGNTTKLYYLIGRFREAKICNKPTEIIIELISREIRNNINLVLSSMLKIENPTLLDVVNYFNNGKYPIYLMNRFDIKLAGLELSHTDARIEDFKKTNVSAKEMRQKEFFDKKSLKLLKKMSNYGLDIYYSYASGPFSLEDFEILEEVKKLSLKK